VFRSTFVVLPLSGIFKSGSVLMQCVSFWWPSGLCGQKVLNSFSSHGL